MLLKTPEYHKLLPAVCTLIEVAAVQWMESATCERGFSIRLIAALMMIDMNGYSSSARREGANMICCTARSA